MGHDVAATGVPMRAGGFYAVGVLEPDRPAVVDADGTVETYGQMLARVNQLCHGLRALGLAAGDAVAVIAGNRIETLEVYAAAMQLGLDVVLANWHLTAPEVEYILDNAGARALIVDARYAEVGTAAADGARVASEARFSMGEAPGFVPLASVMAGQPDVAPDDRHAGQALFYTSGTTGKPKAVRKLLGDLPPERISLMAGIGLRRDPGDMVDTSGRLPDVAERAVHIVAGPLYHAAPLAYCCGALDEGALVVLMERFDPAAFLELLERHRVTHAGMVPIMFHRLLSLPDHVRSGADVSSLQAVTHAGAPCPVHVKHAMIEWFGPVLTEGYSATEGAGTTITSQEWLERPGSVGLPSPGVSVRIIDDDGNDCPLGTPGKVYLTQTLWEFEYQGDPAKTAAARRDGMFTVGDIGYVDADGYLFLCDRDSEIICSGGVNIYPAEIEGVLLSHPAVADGVVIGVPDEEWGEAVRGVVAVRPGTDTETVEADLIAHCRAQLAGYKTPKAIDVVDAIERDPNGKVRKQHIRDTYWQGRERRI